MLKYAMLFLYFSDMIMSTFIQCSISYTVVAMYKTDMEPIVTCSRSCMPIYKEYKLHISQPALIHIDFSLYGSIKWIKIK